LGTRNQRKQNNSDSNSEVGRPELPDDQKSEKTI